MSTYFKVIVHAVKYQYNREYKDLMDLKDPMVNQVTLETADPEESRDNVELRARGATKETIIGHPGVDGPKVFIHMRDTY